MIYGRVRDNFPRVTLRLPGADEDLTVECILDTGFDGDVALPPSLITKLAIQSTDSRLVRFADGSVRNRPYYEVELGLRGDISLAEVIAIEGHPLLGTGLISGASIHIEMIEGGEVSIEF
jgi:predicted aspartyl protease